MFSFKSKTGLTIKCLRLAELPDTELTARDYDNPSQFATCKAIDGNPVISKHWSNNTNPLWYGEDDVVADATNFISLYNDPSNRLGGVSSGRILNIDFPNDYSLKWQLCVSDDYYINNKPAQYAWGFFPTSFEPTTLTNNGLRMLFPEGNRLLPQTGAVFDSSGPYNINGVYFAYYQFADNTTKFFFLTREGRGVNTWGWRAVDAWVFDTQNVNYSGNYWTISSKSEWVPISMFMWLIVGNGEGGDGRYPSEGDDPKPGEGDELPDPGDTPIPGGESETGGGNGSFNDDNSDALVPDLPVTSITSVTMASMYSLNSSQVGALSTYLWDTGLSTIFDKYKSDPMEAIISLRSCPVTPIVGGSTNIKLAGKTLDNVTGSPLSARYADFECGSVRIEPYWNNFLDFNPHTKIEIFIPFLGLQQLDPDVCMNSTIRLTYRVDFFTGAGLALLTILRDDGLSSPTYQFAVDMFTDVPLTARSSDALRSVIQSAASIAGTAVAVGVGGGLGLAAGATKITASTLTKGAMAAGVGAGMVASGAINVMASKTQIAHKAGTMGANGVLGIQTPYVMITRPTQSIPGGYPELMGYPCNLRVILLELEGFTVVEETHMENINATKTELDEIERLLKEGVIL